jgi:peptidoglycan hydrolase-like protein with peptidoglycan-binding domain
MSVPHGILGLVMHTMVGNLPGTISVFNDPNFQASAHFGVSQSGLIHQFGSVRDWKAWAEVAGNPDWYSAEFADGGDPNVPLTQDQINSGAQLLEALSRPDVGNFALQVSNDTGTEGLGVHFMGGAAWGGHTCPDLPPNRVRSSQRPAIVALAKQIRAGAPSPAPAPVPPPSAVQVTLSLPILQQGAVDKPGHVFFVTRMQALILTIGRIKNIPAAACVVANGQFDQGTANALKLVQSSFGITADGICGPHTWSALLTGTS